jgi:hypothetical protein
MLIGARGAIGKQLIIKQYKDKTVLSAMPDFSRRKLSPKQITNNNRMIAANNYAQEILADEQQRNEAQIRLNVLRNKLYYALIKEYYRLEKATEAEQAASAAR